MSGTLNTLTTFPAPSKASSAAFSADQPYFAPITLVTPFATPPPTAQTAPTTPSQRLAITPTPVFAPSLTVSQQGCYCSSFPFSVFSNLSPTSAATFLPNLKRLPTCSEVKLSTFFVVSFANFRLSFVSFDTFLSYYFSTFFEIKPPKLSNPFDSKLPVKMSPLLICLDAPMRMLSFSCFCFSGSSTITSLLLVSTFLLAAFSSLFTYFSFLFLRQHFSPRQENTASEFQLILMIH